jgi:hypothetical protein
MNKKLPSESLLGLYGVNLGFGSDNTCTSGFEQIKKYGTTISVKCSIKAKMITKFQVIKG